MADPAPFQPTMTVCTPLIAGKRQDLQLQIETDRYVRIGIPLGDKPAALMTVDEFNKAGISPLSMLNESETLPPALEQAPEERELGKVGENDFGYIGIPIIPDGGPDTKFAFKIWLQNFAVQKEKGSVAIKLEVRTDDNDNPWTLSAKPTAEKLVALLALTRSDTTSPSWLV